MPAFAKRLSVLKAESVFARMFTLSPATVPALAHGQCSDCCFYYFFFNDTFILF